MASTKKITVAAITANISTGAVVKNTKSIIECLQKAQAQGVELAVLPLDALTGYVGAMDSFAAVKNAVSSALKKIAASTNICCVFALSTNGFTPVIIDSKKVIFNNYYKMKNGLTVGILSTLKDNPLSTDITAVPCSYPAFMGGFSLKKQQSKLLSHNNCVIVASGGDSTHKYVRATDKIICAKGQALAADSSDLTDLIVAEYVPTTKQKNGQNCPPPLSSPSFMPKKEEVDEVLDIIARGIYYRMLKTKSQKIILGLSGGLDSSFVLIAATRAFKKYDLLCKNIIAVRMPSVNSSARTQGNAKILSKQLGVTDLEICINKAIGLNMRLINHKKKDVTYQNVQARIRAQILLNLGNKEQGLVLGTSDLSEIALGFSTYGGDQLCHYNPASGLTKSAIKFVLNQLLQKENLNEELKNCLNDILSTPISPELTKNQSTQSILGPYELHEFFLLRLLAYKDEAKQIFAAACQEFKQMPPALIKKYYKIFIGRFFNNQFKLRFGADGIPLTPFDISGFDIATNFDAQTLMI